MDEVPRSARGSRVERAGARGSTPDAHAVDPPGDPCIAASIAIVDASGAGGASGASGTTSIGCVPAQSALITRASKRQAAILCHK